MFVVLRHFRFRARALGHSARSAAAARQQAQQEARQSSREIHRLQNAAPDDSPRDRITSNLDLRTEVTISPLAGLRLTDLHVAPHFGFLSDCNQMAFGGGHRFNTALVDVASHAASRET